MQHLNSAGQAGQGTPIKEESHIVCGDAALGNNLDLQRDSKQPGAAAQPDHAKHLATLTAVFALVGIALFETTDDRGRPAYVLSRDAVTRQFERLDEIQQLVRQATGGWLEQHDH